MNMMKQCLFASIISISIFSIGCTRNGKSSSMSINISSELHQRGQVAASGNCVNRIMINVTGNDPYIWNSSGDNGRGSCFNVPPSAWAHDFNVSGTVLVQVLVLTEDSLGDMTPYYASVKADASSSSVTLSPAQTNTTIGQGQITGRYLEAGDTNGRTGLVDLYYQPTETGDPAMIVDQSEIFGGWFSFFSPTGGPKFKYVFHGDNTTLFTAGADDQNGATSAVADLVNGTGTHTMVVHTPAGWNKNNQQANGASVIVAGFFGAGNASGTKNACVNTGSSIANYDTLSSGADSGTLMLWNATTASSTAGYFLGGATNTPCSPTYTGPTSTYLTLDHNELGNDGGNGKKFGFFGPFSEVSAPSSAGQEPNFLTVANSSNNVTLTWAFIPGVAVNNVLTGVDVFYTTTAIGTNGSSDWKGTDGDGVDCAAVAKSTNKWGFLSGGSVLATATPTISFNVAGGYNASTFATVVCPFSGTGATKTYFQSALEARPNFVPSNNIQMTLVSSPGGGNTQMYGCQQYTLKLTDTSTDSSYSVPADTQFDLSFGTGGMNVLFYSASGTNCTSQLSSGQITSVTVPAFNSSVNFYISTNSASTQSSSIYINPHSPQNLGFNLANLLTVDFAASVSFPTPTNMWVTLGEPIAGVSQAVMGQCLPVYFRYTNGGSTLATATPYAPSVADTLTLSATNGSFFNAADCNGGSAISGSATAQAGSHSYMAYFKGTGVANALISASSTISSIGIHPATVAIVSNIVQSIQPNITAASNILSINTCYPLNLTFLTSGGATIDHGNLPGAYTFTLNDGSGGGSFFQNQDATCSGSSCCSEAAALAVNSASPPITYSATNQPQFYYLVSDAPGISYHFNAAAVHGDATSVGGTSSLYTNH